MTPNNMQFGMPQRQGRWMPPRPTMPPPGAQPAPAVAPDQAGPAAAGSVSPIQAPVQPNQPPAGSVQTQPMPTPSAPMQSNYRPAYSGIGAPPVARQQSQGSQAPMAGQPNNPQPPTRKSTPMGG